MSALTPTNRSTGDGRMSSKSFHLQQFGPCKLWPDGGWSVYAITAEEIAQRTKLDEHGRIARRDCWPGFVACYTTLEEVAEAIKQEAAQ